MIIDGTIPKGTIHEGIIHEGTICEGRIHEGILNILQGQSEPKMREVTPRLLRRPRQLEEKKEERQSAHTVSQYTLSDNCVLCPGHRFSKCKYHSSSKCWISK